MKLDKLTYTNLIVIGISLSTVFILIYNILYFNPILGYDAEAHYAYINYLSRYLPRDFRLPTINETREFFNPPIGYLVPSIAQVICRNVIESSDFLSDCQPYYGKVTQVFQSFMYIATIFINLVTLKSINNSNKLINVSYLILISLLAVNYRTISMIRGEPYILLFMSILLYLIYKHEKSGFEFNFKYIFYTGLVIGAIALSRQWGFLLFLPLIFLFFSKELNIKYLKLWSLSAFFGAAFSSWFYINLFLRYGTFTPFNLDRRGFSFSNQKLSFYIPNSEHFQYLFTKPIRPHLDNQFISILYSDLWGDYWGYFTFTSRFLDIGRNQLAIGDYFARINIISVFTSIVIIALCIKTFRKYKSRFIIQYLKLAIICSFLGYLIFAIAYPDATSDTVKATYIIQLFHLMVFTASIYLNYLEKINRKIYISIISFLVIAYIHNFQSYLSHFPINFYP